MIDMDLETDLIILRSVERLAAILIGGFFTWLGYRLFLDITVKADSSGKFNLPGGTAIHLTRVGPGIFFALFGTAIVCISFLRPVELRREGVPTGTAGQGSSSKIEFVGAVQENLALNRELADKRNLCRRDIALLNRLPSQLDPNLDASERNSIQVMIPHAKLAIMETLWDATWGDLPAFRDWVNSADSVAPAGLREAEKYFRSK